MKFATKEEIKQKAADLTKELNVEVHPMTFIGDSPDDLVVGFVKEPPFLTKARAMDKVYAGMGFTANIEIMDLCLLKEHSDKRIYTESAQNDRYRLGCAKFCGNLLLLSTDVTEKKN